MPTRSRLLVILIASLASLVLWAGAVLAQGEVYLELVTPTKAAIPGACSSWHELYPAYCLIHHQDDYVDDGSGDVSVCDYIKLDGGWYHIEWAGPTYKLSQGTGPVGSFEPVSHTTGGNPYCEQWMEVHPDYGLTYHVDGWIDNGDGVVSQCDQVQIAGQWWHIDDIRLNIRIRPSDVPIDSQTWGAVKSMY